MILRPMRELSSKEVSLYCVYNRLETWHGQEIQGVGDTIRNVTQEFLVGLQVRTNLVLLYQGFTRVSNDD